METPFRTPTVARYAQAGEAGDDPMQASSTTGATNYVTFVAPSADPPVFRIEDDPPPCA